MKRLLLVVILLALLIPGVLAYQQDFQNYDGADMASMYGTATLLAWNKSEARTIDGIAGGF